MIKHTKSDKRRKTFFITVDKTIYLFLLIVIILKSFYVSFKLKSIIFDLNKTKKKGDWKYTFTKKRKQI